MGESDDQYSRLLPTAREGVARQFLPIKPPFDMISDGSLTVSDGSPDGSDLDKTPYLQGS